MKKIPLFILLIFCSGLVMSQDKEIEAIRVTRYDFFTRQLANSPIRQIITRHFAISLLANG